MSRSLLNIALNTSKLNSSLATRNLSSSSYGNVLSCSSSDLLSRTLQVNTKLKRNFSSSDDSDGTSEIRLPRRLNKRLKNLGISQDEFISKLKFQEKQQDAVKQSNIELEQELDSTVKEYLVKKVPHPSMSEEMAEFPSDRAKYNSLNIKHPRVKIDPSTKSVVLFPGQGSQFVGMGKELLHFPGVNELYEEANSILNYNLLNLCLRGPKSDLDKTLYCQPAVMITSLAAVEKLREEYPNAIENCIATAGFSVGEFTALVFSGVLSFPDAIKAVQARARAMQIASEKIASGMMTVFVRFDSDLKGAMATAKEYCLERRGIEDPVCLIANYLFPECRVIAGHQEALDFIAVNAKEFKLHRVKRLAVSGAFHTQLMKQAVPSLKQAMSNIKINKPKIPVYSNLTGHAYNSNSHFVHKLCDQLVKPVRWEQTMHNIYKRDKGKEFPRTFELGPSKQMGTFLKQLNFQAYQSYHNIIV